jgi:hypothetical protein
MTMTRTVARRRHVIICATSEYENTPWAERAPEDVELHVLVSDYLAGGYAHLPNVQAFANYRTPGSVDLTGTHDELCQLLKDDVGDGVEVEEFVLVPMLEGLPAELHLSWAVGEKVAGGGGRRYDATQKCGDFVVSYLITAPTGDEIDAHFEHIARWFDERVSWSAAPQVVVAW